MEGESYCNMGFASYNSDLISCFLPVQQDEKLVSTDIPSQLTPPYSICNSPENADIYSLQSLDSNGIDPIQQSTISCKEREGEPYIEENSNSLEFETNKRKFHSIKSELDSSSYFPKPDLGAEKGSMFYNQINTLENYGIQVYDDYQFSTSPFIDENVESYKHLTTVSPNIEYTSHGTNDYNNIDTNQSQYDIYTDHNNGIEQQSNYNEIPTVVSNFCDINVSRNMTSGQRLMGVSNSTMGHEYWSNESTSSPVYIKIKESLNNVNYQGDANMSISNFSETNVRTPQSIQQNTSKVSCSKCGKQFVKECYLRQHYQAQHATNRRFRCSKCGKRFETDEECQRHFARHSSDKLYKCPVCTKKFHYKWDLNRHEALHRGTYANNCRYCNKGFARKDHCLKHEQSHERKMAKNPLYSLYIVRQQNKK